MTNTQQPCVDRTGRKSRRVFVDLWAHETLLQKRRIVVEVPSDCTDDEVNELEGSALDDWANDEQVDSLYETEGPDDFQVLESITVESGVPEHVESDLVLVRDTDGWLGLLNEGGQR